MNLEEFKKAMESDATIENERLKKELAEQKKAYERELEYLRSKNSALADDCRSLCNHLLGYDDLNWGDTVPLVTLMCVINALNVYRRKYLETKDKQDWWQMIQLLPSSYNQRRTVMLNYEVLANIYRSRKNHKLDEWHELCAWIESLPYSELITGERGER